MWALTCNMQEECCGVITQGVLCQRCNTEYPSRLVDVFDPLLSPAQVGIGHSCAVAKIQLDVGAQRVTLKHSTARLYSATDEHFFTWNAPHHYREAMQNQQMVALRGEYYNIERERNKTERVMGNDNVLHTMYRAMSGLLLHVLDHITTTNIRKNCTYCSLKQPRLPNSTTNQFPFTHNESHLTKYSPKLTIWFMGLVWIITWPARKHYHLSHSATKMKLPILTFF